MEKNNTLIQYRPWELWHKEEKRSGVLRAWDTTKNEFIAYRRQDFYLYLIDFLNNHNMGRLLDFGCGTCEDYPFFIDNKIGYTGCDITKNMLDIARERFPEVSVYRDDIFAPKTRAGVYDTIISNAVVQHLPRKYITKAIKNLNELPKKYLILRFFCIDNIDFEDNVDGFNHNRFKRETIIHIVNKATAARKTKINWTFGGIAKHKYTKDVAYTTIIYR